jgi:hypothetical protein
MLLPAQLAAETILQTLPDGCQSLIFWAQTGKIKPQIAPISPIQQNRRFQFHKRGQLFIGMHNVTFSVVAPRFFLSVCLRRDSQIRVKQEEGARRVSAHINGKCAVKIATAPQP